MKNHKVRMFEAWKDLLQSHSMKKDILVKYTIKDHNTDIMKWKIMKSQY